MPAKGQAKLTPDQIKRAVESYFKKVTDSRKEIQLRSGDIKVRYEFFPSLASFANHLDIGKQTVEDWINGKYPSLNEADTTLVSEMLARAKRRIEEMTITAALNGDVDSKVASVILTGYGYRDKVEHDVSGGMTVAWEGLKPKEAEDFSV